MKKKNQSKDLKKLILKKQTVFQLEVNSLKEVVGGQEVIAVQGPSNFIKTGCGTIK